MPGLIIGAAGARVKCFVPPVRFFHGWGNPHKKIVILSKMGLQTGEGYGTIITSNSG